MSSDETVVGSSEVRRLEERVRELERMLGPKTMENEILREALAKSEAKNWPCGRSRFRREVCGEADRRGARRVTLLKPARGFLCRDSSAKFLAFSSTRAVFSLICTRRSRHSSCTIPCGMTCHRAFTNSVR